MSITSLDLKADAIAEVARLSRARVIAASGGHGDGKRCDFNRPLIARARRSNVRRALGGRLLMIWRVAYEDPCGRAVESRLVPMLVSVAARSGNVRRRAWIRALLRDIDEPLRRFANNAEPAWRAAVLDVAQRVSAARAERERAVATRSARERRLSQPGLFDRRSEKARRREDEADADAGRDAHARVDAAETTAQLTAREGELLLVLTP